jgi:hypothetical protein
MGRIGYGFGYPLRGGDPFAGVTDLYTGYLAYLQRAIADEAIDEPIQLCLFTRYSLFFQPTRNLNFIAYDFYNVRSDLDNALPLDLKSYVCKRAQYNEILN